MKKMILLVLGLLSIAPVMAQQPVGPVYSYRQYGGNDAWVSGTIPQFVQPSSGVPVLAPSNLFDSGTALYYKGNAIQGSGTVTHFTFPTTLGVLFNCSTATPTTTPVVTCTPATAADNSVYATNGSGTSGWQTTPVFNGSGLTGLISSQISFAAASNCTTSGYVFSPQAGGCIVNGAGSMIYPASGVAVSTGTAWGSSLAVGTGGNSLVQLNSSGQLPAVSGVNLTGMTLSQIGAGASATGTYDFSTATQLKHPLSAGFSTAANGELGYDTTNLNWHIWANGVDNLVAIFPSSSLPTNGDCVNWVKNTNSFGLGDAGSGCGTGSGGAPYPSGSGIPVVVSGTSWGSTVAAPAGAVVGTTDTQTLTNKTLTSPAINSPTITGGNFGTPISIVLTNGTGLPYAGLTGTPTTWNQSTTGTSGGLNNCTTTTAGTICYWNGTTWQQLAGNASGTQYLQETSSGVPSWTTPAGGGNVNSSGTPTAGQVAIWTNATTVQGLSLSSAGIASSGANSTITSLSGLTTPLTVAQGGIGTATAPANSVFVNNSGSSAAPGFSSSPVFSAANLTGFPTFNQPTTATSGGLLGCTTATAGAVCYWNGTAWTGLAGNNSGTGFLQESSSGVPSWTAFPGPAFSGITSGTNSTAAMTVTTGASLGFSGTGTINASSLLSGTWAIPGTIGSTTPNTGAFTALTASTSVGSTPPSGDAGMAYFAGNTVNQTIPANTFAIGGFNTASATAYGWQPSTTAPTGSQVLAIGAPSGGWAPITYLSNSITINSTTCTLGGSCTVSGGGGAGTVTASPQYQIPFFTQSGTVAQVGGSTSLLTDAGGDLIVQTPVASAIANSPAAVFGGVYEVTSGPTYGVDQWSWIASEGTGVNGSSTATLTHTAGSGGFLSVQIPYQVSVSSIYASSNIQTILNQATGATGNGVYAGGQDGNQPSTVEGNGIVRGGNNSSATGTAGNGYLEAGAASTSGGIQGKATVLQSYYTTAALSATFEVVYQTTSGDTVAASPLGNTYTNIGIAQTVGGTNTQLYVATSGKTTTRFDGTPVIGDIACAPPTSTGTTGLAHDNGAAACPAGQKIGLVTGQVSGSGSGATATVLLEGGAASSVNVATGGYLGFYATSGSTISGDTNLDDGVTTANTLTYGGSAGIAAKSYTTTSSGAGGYGVYSSGGTNYTVWGSAATTNNTIQGFATTPVTGDIPDCVSSGTVCTLTDSGLLASTVTTASNTQTLTNKSIVATQLTGFVGTANGGTGFNSSASTGVPQVSAGSWTISTTLPSGLAATNMALTTPSLGAATATSLLASGTVDGQAPVTLTTTSTATLGGTYNSGYTINHEGTAATAVTYTLPTAAVGKQYCVKNGNNGTAANTGVLTLQTSAAGQSIVYNGTAGASDGTLVSGGAAGDSACVVGISTTQWEAYAQVGTWTVH